MSIKAIIFDVSGTVLENGNIQDGIIDLLTFCKKKELKIAFVTNNPSYRLKLDEQGVQYDVFVSLEQTGGKRKPSPVFIKYIEDRLGILKEDFIYVGDNDMTDAFCAAHAHILYFSAVWANPKAKYGIPINKPVSLIKHIKLYLLKEHSWGWNLEQCDQSGRSLNCKAVFDCRAYQIKHVAVNVLKWGNINHKRFILNHLVASIYLSKIYKEIDLWSTYPSHNAGNSINPIMQHDISIISKEFKKKYVDLFFRHTQSPDSGVTRHSGKEMKFENQIGTVHLNPTFKNQLADKRILVLDDFITNGFSNECARNLLYKAGAEDVVSISVGKYGNQYNKIVINSDFDPFKPVEMQNLKFSVSCVNGTTNSQATKEVETSFQNRTNMLK